MRYGGNTPCIAVRRPEQNGKHIVILDAGTGLRALGQELARQNGGNLTADLLVSHTHWDHIQGLPYFAPFFEPGNRVRVWGAEQGGTSLESILREQMNPVVFPVPLDRLEAELTVTHIVAGDFHIDGFAVSAMRLRHPGNTLGFVLHPEGGTGKLAYIADNELTGGTYPVGPEWRRDFIGFLSGADLLIHDAMYDDDELQTHVGWGHSSHVEAVTLAVEAQVGCLVLFHHRPEHDDGMIDAMLIQARETAKRLGSDLEVIAAQEGTTLAL